MTEANSSNFAATQSQPEPTREHWEGVSGIMQYCVTHMAPRVWTGEDNCVYRASWKPSYPELCDFQWMRYSFDVTEDAIADWISRPHDGSEG